METKNECDDCETCSCVKKECKYCEIMSIYFKKGYSFIKYGICLWWYSIFQTEVPAPDSEIKNWVSVYTD